MAWKRLEGGTYNQNDITWIKHEWAERHHELKYGSGYSEAHNRAELRFDGAPWKDQFLGTNYKLSHIYYAPSVDGPSSMYKGLINTLILHYHSGNEFKEV